MSATDPHKSQVLQNFVDRLVKKFDSSLKNLNTIVASIDGDANPQNKLVITKLLQLAADLSTLSAAVASIKGVVINSFGPSGNDDNPTVRAAVDALVAAAGQRLQSMGEAAGAIAGQPDAISADMLSAETLARLNQPQSITEYAGKAGIDLVDNLQQAGIAVEQSPVPAEALQRDLQVHGVLAKFGLQQAVDTIAIHGGVNPLASLLTARVFTSIRARLESDPSVNPYKALLETLFSRATLDIGIIFKDPYEHVYKDCQIGLSGRTPVDGVNQYSDLVFQTARFLVRLTFTNPGTENPELGDFLSVAPTYVSTYKTDGTASWIPITNLPGKLLTGLLDDVRAYLDNPM